MRVRVQTGPSSRVLVMGMSQSKDSGPKVSGLGRDEPGKATRTPKGIEQEGTSAPTSKNRTGSDVDEENCEGQGPGDRMPGPASEVQTPVQLLADGWTKTFPQLVKNGLGLRS